MSLANTQQMTRPQLIATPPKNYLFARLDTTFVNINDYLRAYMTKPQDFQLAKRLYVLLFEEMQYWQEERQNAWTAFVVHEATKGIPAYINYKDLLKDLPETFTSTKGVHTSIKRLAGFDLIKKSNPCGLKRETGVGMNGRLALTFTKSECPYNKQLFLNRDVICWKGNIGKKPQL